MKNHLCYIYEWFLVTDEQKVKSSFCCLCDTYNIIIVKSHTTFTREICFMLWKLALLWHYNLENQIMLEWRQDTNMYNNQQLKRLHNPLKWSTWPVTIMLGNI